MTTQNTTASARPQFKSTEQIYAELNTLLESEKRFNLFTEGTPVHKLKQGKNYFKLIAIPNAPMPFIHAKTFWAPSWGTAFINEKQEKRITGLRVNAARTGTLKCGKNPNGTFDMNFKAKMIFLAVEIIPSTGRGTGATISAPKILVLPSSNMKPQVGDVVAGLANEKNVSGAFKARNLFNYDGSETPIICIEVKGEGRNVQYSAAVDGSIVVPVTTEPVVDIRTAMEYVDDARLFGDEPDTEAEKELKRMFESESANVPKTEEQLDEEMGKPPF